jgi:Sel1 repeat
LRRIRLCYESLSGEALHLESVVAADGRARRRVNPLKSFADLTFTQMQLRSEDLPGDDGLTILDAWGGWTATPVRGSGEMTKQSFLGAALCGAIVLAAIHPAQAEDLRGEPLTEIEQLADSGRADAQRELGIRYGQGTGLSQDYFSARSWSSKAASQGDAWAMRIMGLIYLNGLGVDADRYRAFDYFKRAASAGEMNAQYNLGVLYYDGQITSQDYGKALDWYKRAADQGNAKAQHNLGLMLAHGVGTSADKVEAYKWFELSGSEDAIAATTEMQSIVPLMTKTEVAEAQRRAEIWRAQLEWMP